MLYGALSTFLSVLLVASSVEPWSPPLPLPPAGTRRGRQAEKGRLKLFQRYSPITIAIHQSKNDARAKV